MLHPHIRPIGGYAELDDQGFVQALAKGPPPGPLRGLIRELAQAFEAHYGPRLHSAYLRGSLAFGHELSPLADLDAFVLLHPKPGDQPRWRAMTWTAPLCEALNDRHHQRLNFDLHEASYDPKVEQNYPQLAMLLALQSYCIAGSSLRPRLSRRYKPGPEMCLQLRWLTADSANIARAAPPSAADFRAYLKVLIRSGFELVMAREGRYTTALYFCAQSFARHYPIRAEAMWRLLELFVAGNPPQPQALALALRMSNFILGQAQRYLPSLRA